MYIFFYKTVILITIKIIISQIIKGNYYYNNRLMGRVFANDPGDLGSIPGHVIPKTLKIVLDTSLLNT